MKTKMVSVRISAALYEQIKRTADEERRSLANLAELLLEQGLARYVSPGAKRKKAA